MRREKLIAPPVAIIVFDGMQSHRCAAPPMTSRSIIVTCGPEAGRVRGRGVAGGPAADDHESSCHRDEG